jgi:DNA (cytosine-5)-methyltransferase 1
LFCGAGGAAMGYHRAGFDVTGVDNRPQPRYPFPFVQADAMTFLLDGWDAIHASPPCQDHMRSPGSYISQGTGWMLAATRYRLQSSGVPWVIENVPGAPMRVDLKLCGCMFGLPHLKRERWFETSWHAFDLRQPCDHRNGTMSVTGTSPGSRIEKRVFGRWPSRLDWQQAMGITWMSTKELAQAIPPAYTEHIGLQLLEHLRERAA